MRPETVTTLNFPDANFKVVTVSGRAKPTGLQPGNDQVAAGSGEADWASIWLQLCLNRAAVDLLSDLNRSAIGPRSDRDP